MYLTKIHFWIIIVKKGVNNMSNKRSTDLGNLKVFSDNLKYYLKEQQKTQKEVAAKIGVSTGLFCDWVNGRAYPRMDKLQKIADTLGIKKSDLVEEHSLNNHYYLSNEAKKIADELAKDPELILLHQSFKQLSQSDRALVKSLLERLPKSVTTILWKNPQEEK